MFAATVSVPSDTSKLKFTSPLKFIWRKGVRAITVVGKNTVAAIVAHTFNSQVVTFNVVLPRHVSVMGDKCAVFFNTELLILRNWQVIDWVNG